MNELTAFERRLAIGLEAVAGPRRSIDAIAIARTAASGPFVQNSFLSRFSGVIGQVAAARSRRFGLAEGHTARPLVVLIVVALISALALGVLVVGSGLVRLPSVAPSQPDRSSPSVAPSQLTRGTMWTSTGDPAEIRFRETATLLPNGNVLVVGGGSAFAEEHGFSRSSAELYDPTTGRWTSTGSMHTAREGQTAVLLSNGLVLVLGGISSGEGVAPTRASAELYDSRTGTWTETGRMTTARAYATATLLPDGKVLVTGGASNIGQERSAEVYDPASGTWAATGSMSVARIGHTATLLPDGRVLVAGGQCCSQPAMPLGPAMASAELYDPASGTWTETAALGSARRNHSAILLADGKVLVYGGDNGSDHPAVTGAELYDHAIGTWVATGSPEIAGDRFERQAGGPAVPLSNGKVLAPLKGGSGELFDPSSRSWTAVEGVSGGPYTYVHTATLLTDGLVLITLERWPKAGVGPTPAAALFDPNGTP